MGLAKRIVPCLDVLKGRVVKGINFVQLRDAGDPVEQGEKYSEQEADELVFLDITASHEKRETMKDMVKKVADVVYIPFTVGGGMRTLEDIRSILESGADKISINTAAVERPELISEAAGVFGTQCIVVAIDAKRRFIESEEDAEGRIIRDTEKGPCWFEVVTYGGRKPTGIDALKWAQQVEELGAGEILVTSMDRDGTQIGYDIPVTKAMAELTNLPIIASGGAGTLEHIHEALTTGKADAALIASICHYGKYSIREIKEYLKEKGVPVRL
jgi:cyclase